ncbi:oligosaccharide flippase family protein [Akkermansiaceae bacterium]|nr:oligosaccharide flippase family protein [Akkermansiaceae bacterium]
MLRDISAFALANIVSKLAGLLFVPFIILKISPEEFGLYDSFLVVFTVVSSLIGLGLDSGTANYLANYSRNSGLLTTLYSVSIYVYLLNMLLLFITFTCLSYWEVSLIKISSRSSYMLLWIYVFFEYFNYIAFNFLRWTGRGSFSAGIKAIISLLSYSLGALLITLSQSNAHNLLIGLILGSFVGFLTYGFFSYRYITFKISKWRLPLIRKVLVQSIPFVPMSLTKTLSLPIERGIVSNFASAELYGYYSIFSRVGQMPVFLFASLSAAVHPYLFKGFGSLATKRLTKLIFNSFLISAFFIFIVMNIWESYILQVFHIDEVPNELKGLLSVLFIGQFAKVLRSLFSNGFLVSGVTSYQLILSFIGVLLLAVFGRVIFMNYDVTGFIYYLTLLSVLMSVISVYWSEYLNSSGINANFFVAMLILSLAIQMLF